MSEVSVTTSQRAPSWKSKSTVWTGVAAIFTVGTVALAGCASPPTVGSLAVDRANEVVDAVVSAPDANQEDTFMRELVLGYQNLGSTLTESDITPADRAAMIEAGVKTCRELADGVSESAMRQKMAEDLIQQSPDLDIATAQGVIDANLRAIRAPGSLCP